MTSIGEPGPTQSAVQAQVLTRFRHCPPHSAGRCDCEPTPLDQNAYRLVPLESPQRKPDDTCIRQFLGGEWLDKKDGWSREGEKMYGGDGYHGYVCTGLENVTEGLEL